ncbi:hypothetical protein [Nocardioides sp.]|uniref:hypothetical protein n=1 Tax=Nocardioides sp. TaxID=35761 RepID=UPI002C7C9FC6|nr:hypothetical protein [Nocardioides sp.]HSX67307.1 hypothetical protein [Nocardioides sp.]
MAKSKGSTAPRDLVALVDELAPQIEKTLHQMATKGPKLMNKGRKMAKSKGAKVPKRHVGQVPPGPLTKKLVVLGGVGALVFMAVRRLLGGGAEWQVDPVQVDPAPAEPSPTDPVETEEVETDLS